MEKEKILKEVLAGLMNRYSARVPDVRAIIHDMIVEGIIKKEEDIVNDHIAFRTLGVKSLGIKSLEKIFLYYGYKRCDEYYFAKKKLKAYWYSPPSLSYPRIFISELLVDKLSEKAQDIIRSYSDEVNSDPVDSLDLNDSKAVDSFLHSPLWRAPLWQDYQTLLAESEYASWVIYNRYYLNHFTLTIHDLPEGYNTIESFNKFLEKHGYHLNSVGGKIKISCDKKLLQSSTVAQMILATFAENETHKISGSYVEFAERRVLDKYADLPQEEIQPKHRRDGFETSNADAIFESTYTTQTNKKSGHH